MGAPTNFFVKIHEKSGHVNAAQINIGFNETNGYHFLEKERINQARCVERQKNCETATSNLEEISQIYIILPTAQNYHKRKEEENHIIGITNPN